MRVVRLLVVALTVLLGGAAVAAPASAHNVLRSTAPVADSTLDVPPTEVTLVFDEPAIALGSVIEVTAPDGAVVSDGSPQLRDTSVIQPVRATEAGAYQVVWRVTSSDGHPIEGTFGFSVAAGASQTTSAAADPTSEGGPGAVAPTTTAPAADDGGGVPGWLWAVGALAAAGVVAAAVWATRRPSGARGGPPR